MKPALKIFGGLLHKLSEVHCFNWNPLLLLFLLLSTATLEILLCWPPSLQSHSTFSEVNTLAHS